jgi:hypothetical protein
MICNLWSGQVCDYYECAKAALLVYGDVKRGIVIVW